VNSHKNARLTLEGRKLLIERIAVMGLMPAAEAAGISPRTAHKWRRRFVEQGVAGLQDRSSRPARTRTRVDASLAERIAQLRRSRMPMRTIAIIVGRSLATVSRLLARLGLSSLKALDPVAPQVRYEREAPGELLHIDTKKLGRIVRPSHRVTGDRRDSVEGAGWEFAHVAIDDHSRVGFVQMRSDERKTSAVEFLQAAVAHYAALGVTIKRLITDNGSAYRSRLFAKTCQALGIKHSFTRPYRPQTNGKAERFIQTCLREWAYGRIWANSAERTAWLPAFLSYYNARRPHSALGYKPPASRICGNNLLQLDNCERVHRLNVLKPHLQTTIWTLLRDGATQREIARVTGISRHTIRGYQKQFTSQGDAGPPGAIGSGPIQTASPWPPTRPPGSAPSSITSASEPHRAFIASQLSLNRYAMAVYPDLVDQFGFTGAYNSDKRFAARLRKREPQQFDRLSFQPGEQMQVDYGEGAPTRVKGTERFRKPRLFVATLRYSRRSFRRVAWKSSQEVWARLNRTGAVLWRTSRNRRWSISVAAAIARPTSSPKLPGSALAPPRSGGGASRRSAILCTNTSSSVTRMQVARAPR